ncbi:MAG: right-handed parallel beta-helix repeat-containing protein [Chloroflexota bacterium]
MARTRTTMTTRGAALGTAIVAAVRTALPGHATWTADSEDGFTWWCGWVREEVGSRPAGVVNGRPLAQLRLYTPVFRDVAETVAAYAYVDEHNRFPAMGAWSYDAETRTIGYGCTALAEPVMDGWMTRWLAVAAAIGAMVPRPHASLPNPGWTLDAEPHPVMGVQADPIQPPVAFPRAGHDAAGSGTGTAAPPIPADWLRHLAEHLDAAGIAAAYEESVEVLHAPMPCGPDELAFWALTSHVHPVLGAGLLVRLLLPMRFGRMQARWVANALNRAEVAPPDGTLRAAGFGAWVSDPDGTLAHVLFVPARAVGTLDRRSAASLVELLAAWARLRAEAAAERLPWLRAAAAALHPDEAPPDAAEAEAGAAAKAGGASDGAEEPRETPVAELGFGPRARTPRPRRTEARTDAPRTLIVDPEDPDAYAEVDAAVADADDGDRILVRPGHYVVPVVVDRAVRIEGDGPPEEILLAPVGGECVGFAASGALIRGLTIRPALGGNDGTFHSAVAVHDVAVAVVGCSLSSHLGATAWVGGASARVTFHDCSFPEGTQNALFVTQGARVEMQLCRVTAHGFPLTARGPRAVLRMDECTVEGNLGAGVAALDGALVQLRHVDLLDNAGDGIQLGGAAPASSVQDCSIVGNDGAGIQIRGGQGVRIERNRIERNVAGIIVADGGAPMLAENTLTENATVGIGASDELTHPRAVGNTIRGERASGIVVRNGAGGTFEQNEVIGGAQTGVRVSGEGTRPTFRGNLVHGGPGVGVAVSGGAGGTFEGNDLRGNAGGSWHLAETSAVERSGNLEDVGHVPGPPDPDPDAPPVRMH